MRRKKIFTARYYIVKGSPSYPNKAVILDSETGLAVAEEPLWFKEGESGTDRHVRLERLQEKVYRLNAKTPHMMHHGVAAFA